MAKENQSSMIVVQWKRFAGTDTDYFASLKGFCNSYPGFDYSALHHCLDIVKVPFEDEKIRIEKQPFANGQALIYKVQRPNLPAWLFWEVDYGLLDWQRAYRYVIDRVIDTGAPEDWEEMIRFYGREKVIKTLTQEINYLTDIAVGAVCRYFQLSKESLKCYTKKQLNQGHWI